MSEYNTRRLVSLDHAYSYYWLRPQDIEEEEEDTESGDPDIEHRAQRIAAIGEKLEKYKKLLLEEETILQGFENDYVLGMEGSMSDKETNRLVALRRGHNRNNLSTHFVYMYCSSHLVLLCSYMYLLLVETLRKGHNRNNLSTKDIHVHSTCIVVN